MDGARVSQHTPLPSPDYDMKGLDEVEGKLECPTRRGMSSIRRHQHIVPGFSSCPASHEASTVTDKRSVAQGVGQADSSDPLDYCFSGCSASGCNGCKPWVAKRHANFIIAAVFTMRTLFVHTCSALCFFILCFSVVLTFSWCLSDGADSFECVGVLYRVNTQNEVVTRTVRMDAANRPLNDVRAHLVRIHERGGELPFDPSTAT